MKKELPDVVRFEKRLAQLSTLQKKWDRRGVVWQMPVNAVVLAAVRGLMASINPGLVDHFWPTLEALRNDSASWERGFVEYGVCVTWGGAVALHVVPEPSGDITAHIYWRIDHDARVFRYTGQGDRLGHFVAAHITAERLQKARALIADQNAQAEIKEKKRRANWVHPLFRDQRDWDAENKAAREAEIEIDRHIEREASREVVSWA